MPSHYVFRALGLPMDATPSDFQELRRYLKDREELNLIDEAIVPSCPSGDTMTGLFGVELPLPKFLDKQTRGSTPIFAFRLRGKGVEIDRNFLGFTQLYPTDPEKPIVADIIAVPGLDGHAYGSWKGKGDLQQMWLRDFFPEHFPNCRTMTYGYNARLRSKSVHRILDYSRQFINALEDLRKSDTESTRPLVFIGHSYGGILLAHTLVKAKFDSTGDNNGPFDSLLKATYGILFFGTPHRGMLVQNLLDAVKQSGHAQRKGLLEEIQQNSKSLAGELVRFVDLCAEFKIYSFYEMDQTRKLVVVRSAASSFYATHPISLLLSFAQVIRFIAMYIILKIYPFSEMDQARELVMRTGETWRKEGEFATAVGNTSALLQLPKSIEKPIPVDADHSNFVKFETASNSTYREVRSIIGKMLLEAPATVASRFLAKVQVHHFYVPFARNKGYIGRSAKHACIREKMSGPHAEGHQRLALSGLGGVGKTQDVLDYIYEFKGRVSVFWIYAGSKARFEQDYRKLAVMLQLPGHDDMKKDIRSAVKAWLEGPASGNWILVLDNADNMLDFYPETQPVDSTEDDDKNHGLAEFVPQGSKGTVLVTTRDHSVADTLADMNVVTKHVMSPEEAMQLFKNQYPHVTEDEGSVNLLLEKLDYLPLAITQATAYLRQNRLLRPSGYLEQFAATKRDQQNLLSKPFRDLRREPGLGLAGAETILATFAITFEQIQRQWPLAGSFLEIMACIDRQGIPADLFRESVPEGMDINSTTEALSKLMEFALITETVIGNGFSFVMHALVHISAQEFISTKERMQAAMENTGEILRRTLPGGEHEHWNVGQPTYRRFKTANTPSLSEDTATIYYLVSKYLQSTGLYNEAEDKAKISANMRTSILGAEHPLTLTSISNLALTYWKQGRWKEAEELEVAVVEARQRVLGQEHPDTLTSMNNLASTYRNQGRWKEAEELEVAVVEARKRVLGQEHPHTLTSMNNLASTYSKQERWKEAEELKVAVLEARKGVLSQEHPQTLNSMGNLALTYRGQGRWKEAEELEVAVMEARKRVLGQEHPDTLISMNNLAHTLQSLGHTQNAIVMMTEVLLYRTAKLGVSHPHTKASQLTLSNWNEDVDDAEDEDTHDQPEPNEHTG